MKTAIITAVLASILVVGLAPKVFSHSGGTNFAGCHWVWKNGVRVGYHCHHSALPESIVIAQSPYTRYPGYTRPARPSYTVPSYRPRSHSPTLPYADQIDRKYRRQRALEQQRFNQIMRDHREADRGQEKTNILNCYQYNKGCALQLRGLGR